MGQFFTGNHARAHREAGGQSARDTGTDSAAHGPGRSRAIPGRPARRPCRGRRPDTGHRRAAAEQHPSTGRPRPAEYQQGAPGKSRRGSAAADTRSGPIERAADHPSCAFNSCTERGLAKAGPASIRFQLLRPWPVPSAPAKSCPPGIYLRLHVVRLGAARVIAQHLADHLLGLVEMPALRPPHRFDSPSDQRSATRGRCDCKSS